MIQNDITLLTHRWLKDPTYGVEAMMAFVPNKTPEGINRAAVQMPEILNDVETEGLIGNADLITLPTPRALVVYCDTPIRTTQQASKTAILTDDPIYVTVAWITREIPPGVAVLDGGVLLRATELSLYKWNNQSASVGKRELNGVFIAKVESCRTLRVSGAVGKSSLWGFVQANLKVIDTVRA